MSRHSSLRVNKSDTLSVYVFVCLHLLWCMCVCLRVCVCLFVCLLINLAIHVDKP